MKQEIKQQLKQQGYLTLSEMASELGISISTLIILSKRKTFPRPLAIERAIYFDKKQVIDFLKPKKI
jgi:predicted DNA-binding transcriptional regulator AlpA